MGNRDIKFRGLSVDGGVWCYGYYWKNEVSGNCFIRLPVSGIVWAVINKSVGQFTGLKDRNGVDIYEGDIIKWGHLSGSIESPVRVAIVDIKPDIQFRLINGKHIFNFGDFMYARCTHKVLEITGNIHQP